MVTAEEEDVEIPESVVIQVWGLIQAAAVVVAAVGFVKLYLV